MIWLVLCVALWLLLSRTVVGRHLYAMGGNEEAARLSGIRTDRLKWLAYCLSSMTAALAGVLYACYIGTTSPVDRRHGVRTQRHRGGGRRRVQPDRRRRHRRAASCSERCSCG